ncbi:cellulose synthase subunit BcsC [Blastopirellula retiformator]|uniref:Cellulose synthase subunit BcsC n=2 Tax=Blastopirellula retiformator TaxID=2527970 RepID=A0A5C5V469_9BACT|nr:cellulose synthase subunit BcsC [Blastopirellula retiformator]
MATETLQSAIQRDPNNPVAHTYAALACGALEQANKSDFHMQEALRINPEFSFAHFIHSTILSSRNRADDAERSIREAIRIDPDVPVYYARLGEVMLETKAWSAAQQAAEQGLALDPDDVKCLNIRATALTKQGKTQDAADSMRTALRRDPDNADTHTNLGWSLLQAGEHQQAAEHFGEALRINPQDEMARVGLVECLKARNVVYSLMLRYFLWMSQQSGRMRWFVIIGLFVGYRAVQAFARANPEYAVWTYPVVAAYIAFVLMSWIASPLFDLVLRLDRLGRLALSKEQIQTSNWIGICLIGSASSLLFLFGAHTPLPTLYVAVSFAVLLPSVAHIHDCDKGWPRYAILAIFGLLALLGSICVGASIASQVVPEDTGTLMLHLAVFPFFALCFGGVASQFATNFLVAARVRR